MLAFYLRKTVCSRQYQAISTVVLKQHCRSNWNEPILSCYSNHIISNHIPCRQFSFAGFYTAISQSTPVLSLQSALLDVHQSSGLPWWSLIMLSTLGIRTLIVFPLAVHQNQVIARLANIHAEIGKLVPELNKEVNIAKVMYKFDEDSAKKLFRKQLRDIHNKFVLRDNCHPFKTVLLALIQIPVWICFSVSLRNLTLISAHLSSIPESIKQLKSEGVLWFSDLTCPDPIFIPLLLLVVNLGLIEVHALRQIGKGTLMQKIVLNSSRVITVVVAAIAAINPSSVTFYWLCSSTYGMVQSLLFVSPKLRRALRIPATANESSTPFRDIVTNFKARFNKRNSS